MAFAQAEKVYVTRTGAKYHRESCSSLRSSKIEMTLAEAAASTGSVPGHETIAFEVLITPTELVTYKGELPFIKPVNPAK